ncbi:MAG TPA: hypothetical protein VFI38_12200 [Candidatus Acidoferrum sp.]|nr:hypothetical protein [Candidatus Acidoferrum sp.]
MSVFPSATSVVLGQTVPFSATVTGTTNTGVNWEVAGILGGNATVGTINTAGLYTAPNALPNPTTVVVTAVSQADPTKTGTGRVQVFQSNPNQNAQSLPIELGTSGGNVDDKSGRFCCGGTLGSLLTRNGSFYILSNNHVLARSDQASPGEPISQPAIIETNCSTVGTNTVAHLTSFVNLQASGTNVDAAIALIAPGAVDLTGKILLLGSTATGSTPDPGPPHQGRGILASIGKQVAKSGRTTGLTCSTVAATNLSTVVTYQTLCNGGTTFSVTYRNQISVSGGGFSAGGDSGSLIVDQLTADPVALLYGGSDTDTVGNPVGDVLTELADPMGNQPSFVGSASTHPVIGCTLAGAVVKAAAQPAMAVDAASIAVAQRARDSHAPELLANPYIYAVGVAPSMDRPGDAAVLLVVNPGQKPTPLPATIDGVATRIVAMGGAAPHGILEYETAARIVPAQDVFAVNALDQTELERAKAVHAAHVDEWMKQSGVQGVGITSSADAPGEAALMIYLVRGAKHNAIPAVIDGLRTRVRETSRFTAGRRGQEPEQGCRVPATMPTKAARTKP